MYNHPDLHMHSTKSDGTDTPLEILDKVRQTDIDFFSLTDHDSYFGCKEIEDNIKPGDPTFLPGIEFSCKDEQGKCHILGYCYDVQKGAMRDTVAMVQGKRHEKAVARFDYLKDECGFTFTAEEENEVLSQFNPGKPHFVDLLLRKGYVHSRDEGFEVMNGYHGKAEYLTPERAIDVILASDGIPVLAHGIKGAGSLNMSAEEIEQRVARLKGAGLMGLECYYSTYTPLQTEIMLNLAQKYKLLVTAGSDYHGTKKPIALGESGGAEMERMSGFYKASKFLLGI